MTGETARTRAGKAVTDAALRTASGSVKASGRGLLRRASQSLTAVDGRHILAATEDGVYESTDAGKTCTQRLTVTNGGHH
ncbi:hypothetical protein [Streptomyces sp. NPDC051909]|uniref:hypothetical protein n=1 Tax=Streptomyces sp. NPDC051909 TaxID=3154944 RepID=UPI00342C4F8A